MKLLGTEFGNVFCASGARNFFGEGWNTPQRFFLNWKGSTLVTKTTTVDSRMGPGRNEPGNMDLDKKFQPTELMPDCIKVYPLKGVVLNSVGLTGPGAERLLIDPRWSEMEKPFFISFMSVQKGEIQRTEEFLRFVEMLSNVIRGFKVKIGLEINFSCPNVGLIKHDQQLEQSFVDEVIRILARGKYLGIPLIAKLSATTSVQTALQIAADPNCSAITISNTIPWGAMLNDIAWVEFFGTSQSPLKHLSGGGLSGWPLLPIVERWIKSFRQENRYTPIIGGGGILKKSDADRLINAGANSIFLGSVAILRPWRVQGIIQHVNNRLG